MKQVMHMKELIRGANAARMADPLNDAEMDFMDDAPENEMVSSIPVEFVDVEQVVVTEIKDVKGRLSDIVESIEIITGMSTIPLEMAGIAPEVVKLQRHDILTIGNERYAMSRKVREAVVNEYVQKIVQSLSNGLPFVENLTTLVTYCGKDYKTIRLSKAEWTLLLSKFKTYKQSLRVLSNGELVLEVSTEHT